MSQKNESSQQSKKILIGLPCASGFVPLPMVQSLLELVKPLPCAFMSVERQRIDKVRNHMAMQALNGGFDYLLMIDDDNPIPQDTIVKMIEDDKDVVVAPILARNPGLDGKHQLCAFYRKEVEVRKKKLRLYHPIDEFRDTGHLHKVDAAGTGCILIKRPVLEAMYKKYDDSMFEFGDITVGGQRRTMSEDCEFSERVSDLGFEIWLDERIRPFHLAGFRSVRYKG